MGQAKLRGTREQRVAKARGRDFEEMWERLKRDETLRNEQIARERELEREREANRRRRITLVGAGSVRAGGREIAMLTALALSTGLPIVIAHPLESKKRNP